MLEAKIKEKGIVLLVVLSTIFIVILLANILVGIMVSQSRLTRHKTSRIQAHYAAMAGINYAYESLRTGSWAMPAPSYVNAICKIAGVTPQGVACGVVDTNFPNNIPYILIAVAANGAGAFSVGAGPNQVNFPACVTSSSACIYAYSNYTYTP